MNKNKQKYILPNGKVNTVDVFVSVFYYNEFKKNIPVWQPDNHIIEINNIDEMNNIEAIQEHIRDCKKYSEGTVVKLMYWKLL